MQGVLICTLFFIKDMNVKKENIGKRVYSQKAGMLLEVTAENYELLKDTHKELYVKTSKKSSDKNSADTSGEGDS